MAAILLSDEVQRLLDAEAQEQGFSSSSEYLTVLVRQDQERRAKADLEIYVLEGVDSGDVQEMTPQAWRDLRMELHRQVGIE